MTSKKSSNSWKKKKELKNDDRDEFHRIPKLISCKASTMYYIRNVTFIEQPIFTRSLFELVDDDAYHKFQNELAANPEKGPVVKGSGGLRKARLALPGRGKSGGGRVLYLWFPRHSAIVLYLVYTKGDMENVPAAQMKAIKHEVQRIKKAFGEGD